VLRTLSLCTCCRHYPGAAAGRTLRSASPSRISLPRKGCRVGLRIVLFEDCSAFTRVTACTLTLSPIRDTLIEGFSHFVASMTAPIASGLSGCRVGFAPTGKRRLVTAHARLGHSAAVFCRRQSGAVGWTASLLVVGLSPSGPWPRPVTGTSCALFARSSTTRRSSPSPHCPRRCRNG
jgi:hypothetical protein